MTAAAASDPADGSTVTSHGGSSSARCRSATFLPFLKGNVCAFGFFVHLEQSRLWFTTSVPQMQTRAECAGTLCGMCVRACVRVCVRVCLRQSAGLYVAAGSFMWPFVLFMCSCLSSVLCTDGSVPVIDGTLLLWCSRFNGA